MTGAHVIAEPRGELESWLVQTVSHHAQAAGIGMPQVAIFDSPEPNAFATGARRDAALVAVSTGLLRGMSRDEVEAVLAHEVSHIANGDMVTLTLIQGVLNTFVLFLSRVVGDVVDRAVFRKEGEGHGPGVLHHLDRRADRARHPREPRRHVVLAAARVPRRRGRRAPRRPREDDRRRSSA